MAGRMCVALHLDDQQVGLWRLPGIFEVVHMDEMIVGGNRQYPKGSVKCLLLPSHYQTD